MREVTKTFKIYKVDELSDWAKEQAYNKWLGSDPYSFGYDNERTLEKFESVFPVRVIGWQYGDYNSFINFNFTGDGEWEEMTGVRLLKHLYSNYEEDLFRPKYYSSWKSGRLVQRHSKIIKTTSCVLTGYYMDDIILEPIYKFLKSPDPSTNFYDLMKECLESWISGCNKDVDSTTSMEYFLENSRDNDYEYYEDGELYLD